MWHTLFNSESLVRALPQLKASEKVIPVIFYDFI